MHIKSAFFFAIIAIVAARNIASKYLLVDVEDKAKLSHKEPGE